MKELAYSKNMSEAKQKYLYECVDCGRNYDSGSLIYLCPACSNKQPFNQPPRGVLKVIYDYEHIAKHFNDFGQLKAKAFIDLLPLNNFDHWPNLRIGMTPLYRFVDGKGNGSFDLFFKDDSQNPSFSFKDRASALVSAYAKEKGMDTIVTASTGNAGSSIAAICANQGQRAIVMLPASAPKAKLLQIVMYGARIVPVNGSYDDAFELSKQAGKLFNWYNRNTAYNPMTIEGKKTAAFEIFDQLNGTVPDNIFVPVGDGVIIAGLFKGFEELLLLGMMDKMPNIIAIQSENSDNLVRNISADKFRINSKGSLADSITVNVPRNYFMTKQYLEKYEGQAFTVSDQSILEASKLLSKKFGLFAEPAAAAAYAGYLNYQDSQTIQPGTKNIVLLTGSGLKDVKALEQKISIPEPVEANLESLKQYLNG